MCLLRAAQSLEGGSPAAKHPAGVRASLSLRVPLLPGRAGHVQARGAGAILAAICITPDQRSVGCGCASSDGTAAAGRSASIRRQQQVSAGPRALPVWACLPPSLLTEDTRDERDGAVHMPARSAAVWSMPRHKTSCSSSCSRA